MWRDKIVLQKGFARLEWRMSLWENQNPKTFEFDKGENAKTGTKASTIKRKKSSTEKDMIQRMLTLVKKVKKKAMNDDVLSRPTVDTHGEEDKERVNINLHPGIWVESFQLKKSNFASSNSP